MDGHLGCFLVLGIVDRAAVNIGCMSIVKFWFRLGVCSGVGLLDRKAALVLAF